MLLCDQKATILVRVENLEKLHKIDINSQNTNSSEKFQNCFEVIKINFLDPGEHFSYEIFFWGQFWDPMGAVLWIISAGSGFRRVKIEWCGHIYLYSGQPTFLFYLHPLGTFSDHLREVSDFAKNRCFQNLSRKFCCLQQKISKFSQNRVLDLKCIPHYWYGAITY